MPDKLTPQKTGFEYGENPNIMNANERIKTGNFNDTIREVNNFENSQIFETGDKCNKGRFTCTNCGTDITITNNNLRLPPCPRCGNTEFYIHG